MQPVDVEAYKITHPKDEKGHNSTVVFGTFRDAMQKKDEMLTSSGRTGERDFRALFQISPVLVYVEEQTSSDDTQADLVTIQ